MQHLKEYVDTILRRNNIDLSKLDADVGDSSISKKDHEEGLKQSNNLFSQKRNPFQTGFVGKKSKDIYPEVQDTVDKVLSYTFPIDSKPIPDSVYSVGDQFIVFDENGHIMIGIITNWFKSSEEIKYGVTFIKKNVQTNENICVDYKNLLAKNLHELLKAGIFDKNGVRKRLTAKGQTIDFFSKVKYPQNVANSQIIEMQKMVKKYETLLQKELSQHITNFENCKKDEIFMEVSDFVEKVLSYTEPINSEQIPSSMYLVGDIFLYDLEISKSQNVVYTYAVITNWYKIKNKPNLMYGVVFVRYKEAKKKYEYIDYEEYTDEKLYQLLGTGLFDENGIDIRADKDEKGNTIDAFTQASFNPQHITTERKEELDNMVERYRTILWKELATPFSKYYFEATMGIKDKVIPIYDSLVTETDFSERKIDRSKMTIGQSIVADGKTYVVTNYYYDELYKKSNVIHAVISYGLISTTENAYAYYKYSNGSLQLLFSIPKKQTRLSINKTLKLNQKAKM